MLETFWRGRPPVGLRTLKTALAVILSLLVVQQYGASPAKVVFATIGAMSAVGPTFTASPGWRMNLSLSWLMCTRPS